MIDHAALRKLWHSNEPLTVDDVRMSVNRNRTALPTTPKSFEVRTLELLEALEEQVIRHGYHVGEEVE